MDVTKFLSQTGAESRPYQLRVVEKAYECFVKQGMRSVLIESPTGSGKTVMSMLLAYILHKENVQNIAWVAMRKHLLTQAQNENLSKGFNIPLQFVSMFDKDPPKNIDLLIVDEAQHDVTSSMAHLYSIIKPKRILGLSATPYRSDRIKLCFDTVIKDAGIPTLIREGYLSRYHHYEIPKWGVEEVVRLYTDDPMRWGKTIIYFHRLAECAEAQQKLTTAGISCDTVSGSSNIDAQIDAFRTDKLQVVVNCQKLTEGFDFPGLQTVMLRPSCKSVTIQMAGRVLRKHPDFEYKQIVQCMKTPYPFMKTALADLQYVLTNGEWRTLQVNPHIEAISRRMVHALAGIEVKLPNFLLKVIKAEEAQRKKYMHRHGTGAMPGLAGVLDPSQGELGDQRQHNEFDAMEDTLTERATAHNAL